MEINHAVSSLAALAQENRLRVFRFLVQRGPDGACPGDIVEATGIAPATLSFHLKALTHAGLLHVQRRGRHLEYRADFDAVRGLIEFLTENCCDGDPSRCLPAAGLASATAPREACR
jgi:ArsR family transcriptional regulator, arsenate/arsenite/antimonite-responsive transcriptional repressor